MFKTQRLVLTASLSALSVALMFFSFPIIPGADFLKIDLSVLPVLLGLVLFNLKTAYVILLVRTALKLLLNNRGVNDFIGLPMNVIALAIFVGVFAFIWKKQPNLKSYLIASGLATLALTLAMLLLNWVYAIPLYAKFANFDIAQYIGTKIYLFSMVLPFNLVQGVIFSLVFWFVARFLEPILVKYSYET